MHTTGKGTTFVCEISSACTREEDTFFSIQSSETASHPLQNNDFERVGLFVDNIVQGLMKQIIKKELVKVCVAILIIIIIDIIMRLMLNNYRNNKMRLRAMCLQ